MKKDLGHEAIYDARQLGTPRMLILGLQRGDLDWRMVNRQNRGLR